MRSPWWRGSRGEYYVLVQMLLLALIGFGPIGPAAWPAWTLPLGIALFALGPSLTPLPKPKDGASLVEGGPYALVRHPIYSGLILSAFGFALWRQGWLTLGYAALLLIFFDLKSRREERWLAEKYLGYAAYRARVKKLIPGIY
jgi:protein-S-isoprenylcysteine O-methyltransferase Ste14